MNKDRKNHVGEKRRIKERIGYYIYMNKDRKNLKCRLPKKEDDSHFMACIVY